MYLKLKKKQTTKIKSDLLLTSNSIVTTKQRPRHWSWGRSSRRRSKSHPNRLGHVLLHQPNQSRPFLPFEEWSQRRWRDRRRSVLTMAVLVETISILHLSLHHLPWDMSITGYTSVCEFDLIVLLKAFWFRVLILDT